MVVSRFVLHRRVRESGLTAQGALRGEAGAFALVLIASWIMAKIENRKIGDYGLPWQRAFCGPILARPCHRFCFDHGPPRGHVGCRCVPFRFHRAAWSRSLEVRDSVGLAFLFVGLFEEFFFRGYALFTLTTGIGFWPAAILCSVVFGYVHHSNPGETWVGAFAAGFVGLIFCLLLRRTGDLWMPIGFHASWDWGETYFYGVPDSGQVATGHLLNANFTARNG